MTAAIYKLETKKNAQFICSACGADRSCDCNAPEIKRAADAIAANPGKSIRAIAAEIGVDEKTVRNARSTAESSAVEERTGLDGRTRKMPERPAAEESLPTAEPKPDATSPTTEEALPADIEVEGNLRATFLRLANQAAILAERAAKFANADTLKGDGTYATRRVVKAWTHVGQIVRGTKRA